MAMPSRRLGALDLQVPLLGFGGAPVGHATTAASAASVIARAYARGLRFFDTAPLYGAGRSETHLGHALRGKARSSFVLATKVGMRVNAYGVDVRLDFSYDGVLRSVEESLDRLRLEAVDILHIHEADAPVAVIGAEAYAALDALRRQGRIKGVGLGVNRWQLGRELMRYGRFDCLLLASQYTLLHQEGLDFIHFCRAEGVGVILGGVFNSGILATGATRNAQYAYRLAPPAIRARVAALEAACREFEVPLATAALQFPLMHPGVTSVVVGMEEPAQVDRNVDSLATRIPPAFWTRLKTCGALPERAPTRAAA